MKIVTNHTTLRCLCIAVLLASILPQAKPQGSLTSEQLAELVHTVAETQTAYITSHGRGLRFHLHRIDPKENTVRDLIESRDGNVGRLLRRNDAGLTAAEDRAERDRLQELLTSGVLEKKAGDDGRPQEYAVELVRAMPDAMLYTLTPGQPQLPNLVRPQIVLDYTPNPTYHPKSTAETLLSGISGRLWADAADHHLVRMEIDVNRNLNLAWGILIRVFSGGRIEYDQRRVAENTYAYTHIRIHLKMREFMVKTVPYDSDLTAFDFQLLPAAPSGSEAIHMLLDRPRLLP